MLKGGGFCDSKIRRPRLNCNVQLEWFFGSRRSQSRSRLPAEVSLVVNGQNVPLRLVPNRRARRYVLRLRPDGVARVAIPRGGSAAEARRFAERNIAWLERQLHRLATQPRGPQPWPAGTEILFRGELVRLHLSADESTARVQFATEDVPIQDPSADLRREVERHLWRMAARELSERVLILAREHGRQVRRITVRNQRSRWGSCSRRGTISLNWRLIQAPPQVRDYIILHELAHLKEMNHSRRFWAEVARLCPNYEEAERWLKRHSALLRH